MWLRAVIGSLCPIDFQIGRGGDGRMGGRASENLGQRTPVLKINTQRRLHQHTVILVASTTISSIIYNKKIMQHLFYSNIFHEPL